MKKQGQDKKQLQNKVAIVTGGGTTIGLDQQALRVARELWSQGFRILFG
jgi:NAD(P)-dependent dehydrogenase (short-subunit alcohol dehydrogenase family)